MGQRWLRSPPASAAPFCPPALTALDQPPASLSAAGAQREHEHEPQLSFILPSVFPPAVPSSRLTRTDLTVLLPGGQALPPHPKGLLASSFPWEALLLVQS